jgi:DNA-binding NarL/FixJ family response regulator
LFTEEQIVSTPKNKPAKRRVLVVDDHPMTRDGLAHLINGEVDMVVAWQSETACQALKIIVDEKPDLVLMDITLPDKNGIDLIKDMKAIHPDIAVLVISMHDESLYAERALRAGARGYITKQEGGARLMVAIRQVLSGQMYVSEKTSSRILEIFSGKQSCRSSSLVGQLTDREFEIFQLIGQGLSAHEIGERIMISAKTVETHRVNIKAKLGLATAAELIAYAARWQVSQNADVLQ